MLYPYQRAQSKGFTGTDTSSLRPGCCVRNPDVPKSFGSDTNSTNLISSKNKMSMVEKDVVV